MLSESDSTLYIPQAVMEQVNGIVVGYLREKYPGGLEYPFPSRDVSEVTERVRGRLMANNEISLQQRTEAERMAGLKVCDWHMRRPPGYKSSTAANP